MTDSDQTEDQPDSPEPASPEPDAGSESPPDDDHISGEPTTPYRSSEDRPRLYRSEEERILGGVAAGLAHHFDADPVIVRLLWVLLVLLGGIGVLAYLVLWVVLPPYSRVYGESDSAASSAGQTLTPAGRQRSPLRTDLVIGGILIVVGALLLIGNINIGPGWNIFGRLWPLLLIAPAAAMVAPRRGRWPPTGVLVIGGVILTVGAISLIGSLDIWWGYGAWGRLWPLILIVAGAAFILPRLDRVR